MFRDSLATQDQAARKALVINQRWRFRRTSYRPPEEVIDTARYEVAPLSGDCEAKQSILTHHYSQTYVAARFRFGLYTHGQLVGVAVFSHPVTDAVLTNIFPGDARESCELGRFVLLDEVPGNGESWFLARCFDHLRQTGIRGVVSYSDPVPRTTSEGVRVHTGHIGTCYQASNAHFLGRATPRTIRLLPDGRLFHERAAQKIRGGERGWEAAAALLEAYGATAAPRTHLARIEWFEHWREKLTRRVRHAGNYKYAWGLDRATRGFLPRSLPYPKLTEAQLALWSR